MGATCSVKKGQKNEFRKKQKGEFRLKTQKSTAGYLKWPFSRLDLGNKENLYYFHIGLNHRLVWKIITLLSSLESCFAPRRSGKKTRRLVSSKCHLEMSTHKERRETRENNGKTRVTKTRSLTLSPTSESCFALRRSCKKLGAGSLQNVMLYKYIKKDAEKQRENSCNEGPKFTVIRDPKQQLDR